MFYSFLIYIDNNKLSTILKITTKRVYTATIHIFVRPQVKIEK